MTIQANLNPGADAASALSSVASRHLVQEQILAQIDQLAALPEVVVEIMRIADDPESSLTDLEKALAMDPVVAARVLKLANSGFFARGAASTTLAQAVRLLGFRTIKNLVLAASTGKVLTKRLVHYRYESAGLWQHSLAVGLTARAIARGLGLERVVEDEVFLAGLLHDVGKLILDPFVEEVNGSPVTTETERALLSLDHATVGAQMAAKWRLPGHATEAIQAHHDPALAPQFARHAGVVSLCDYFMNQHRLGLSQEALAPEEPHPNALDCLGLSSVDLPDLGERIAGSLDDVLGMVSQLKS